ncbi:MAG: VCBS repeat-containing protein [Planctomycetales bacterium]|nr:VCBS repeat-containing protein [Planctomycetales bacterium]
MYRHQEPPTPSAAASPALARWTVFLVGFAVVTVLTVAIARRVVNRDSEDTTAKSNASDDEQIVTTPTSPNEVPLAEIVTPQTQLRQTELSDALSPLKDGWTTELLAEQISVRLKSIAKLLEGGDVELSSVVNSSATFDGQLNRELSEVYRDHAIVVRREPAPKHSQTQTEISPPPASATDALLALRKSLGSQSSDVRVALKVFRVDPQGNSVAVQALFESRTQMQSGAIQQNATWHTMWSSSDNAPRLQSLRIERLEEVESLDTPVLFSDCTESVLQANDSFRDQLRFGSNYWMPRLESYLSPRLLEGHIGLAIGDVNEDGLDDIYVCQPGGLPNRLFVQNPDGTATDVSAKAGVDVLDWSYSSLIVDFNNDGHQDLAVLADTLLLIFSGDGTGQFTVQQRVPSDCEYSLTAADFDNDGDLDLYACNYFADSSNELAQLGRTDPLHNSNTGGRNVLYRNEGNWTFVDVTDQVGLDENNRQWSLAAAWEDYDNDGDQDLYVVNDFGHNNLYRNDGGQFTEVAANAGATDANQGMSATWADYDVDGWIDVYVSNMYSAAGNRVTFQPQFMTNLRTDAKSLYQQLARGNSLLRNLGDGAFRDASVDAAVTMGRWAWASLFCDINNDGLEDLLVANGYLTQDSQDDL